MKRLLLGMVTLLCFASGARAQTIVSGTIKDSQNIPYTGAVVRAFSSTPGSFSAITGDGTNGSTAGYFQMQIPVGTYTFTVSAQGVQPPLGTGAQQFTVGSVAISGATQNLSSTLSNASKGLLAVSLTVDVAHGTATMGTSAISANTCATAVAVSVSGVATTDVIDVTPNADITAITGFGATSSEGLDITWYPTSGGVNFKVCNPTGNSITPGSAAVLNWAVRR